MLVGTEQTYTYIGQEELTFANCAKAVRRGNTFITSEPVLLFPADGRPLVAEITLGSREGTVEVPAEAQIFVPFYRPEIVLNDRFVTSREDCDGICQMTLSEKVKVVDLGWIAARFAAGDRRAVVADADLRAHLSCKYHWPGAFLRAINSLFNDAN